MFLVQLHVANTNARGIAQALYFSQRLTRAALSIFSTNMAHIIYFKEIPNEKRMVAVTHESSECAPFRR